MLPRISQSMAQTQQQRMSQAQIMSLKMLSMSGAEVRDEIYSYAEKNPALEIKSDYLENGVSSSKAEISNNMRFSDNTRYGNASASGEMASNNFQAALESNADEREPLSDHLLHQLNSMNLPEEEKSLCQKLIYNLDENGFHILAPISFLNPENPLHTNEFLKNCLFIVQNLDPVGTCTDNYIESLFVQAKISKKASELTLFLLKSHAHFEFLNPPQIQKIQKKIANYLSEQKKLKFTEDFEESEKNLLLTDDEIQSSLDFIKKLDPYPARNFGTRQTNFISPDVYVTKNPNFLSQDENSEAEFIVNFSDNSIPKLDISKQYKNLIKTSSIIDNSGSEKSEKKRSELKFAKNSVNEAKYFIDSIQFRKATLINAVQEIVRIQADFFRKGPGFLIPLRQKEIAASLSVHETTISRMANSKYLSCEWGIFPIGYFFTNAVGTVPAPKEQEGSKRGENSPSSKESVKFEISKILDEHKNDKKALSDQKISELLAEKGIKVARRTVAKYRGELNINSSYER